MSQKITRVKVVPSHALRGAGEVAAGNLSTQSSALKFTIHRSNPAKPLSKAKVRAKSTERTP